MSEWISVKDRTPSEDSEQYLLFTDSEQICYGRYYDANIHQDECLWKSEGPFFSDRITHWMPLPELPKE